MFELNPVELNTNPGHNRFILNHIENYFNGFQLKIISIGQYLWKILNHACT